MLAIQAASVPCAFPAQAGVNPSIGRAFPVAPYLPRAGGVKPVVSMNKSVGTLSSRYKRIPKSVHNWESVVGG